MIASPARILPVKMRQCGLGFGGECQSPWPERPEMGRDGNFGVTGPPRSVPTFLGMGGAPKLSACSSCRTPAQDTRVKTGKSVWPAVFGWQNFPLLRHLALCSSIGIHSLNSPGGLEGNEICGPKARFSQTRWEGQGADSFAWSLRKGYIWIGQLSAQYTQMPHFSEHISRQCLGIVGIPAFPQVLCRSSWPGPPCRTQMGRQRQRDVVHISWCCGFFPVGNWNAKMFHQLFC